MKRPQWKTPDWIPDWLPELPVLSIAVALLWLVVSASVLVGWAGQLRLASNGINTAAQFAIRDPLVEVRTRHLPLVRAVKPDFENDTVLGFMRASEGFGGSVSAQQRFEELAQSAERDLDGHPFRILGLIPARLTAHGFATHPFVHASATHLLATLLLFLLAAPLLEARWGRPLLSGTMLVCGVAGAFAFCLAHPHSERALLGGSAITAGLVAAVVVRFGSEEIDFLGPFSRFVDAEISAPAWMLGALWLGYELFLWWSVQGALPLGIDSAVGYTAHAAAAAVGGALPFATAKLGLEKELPPLIGARPKTEKRAAPQASASRFDIAKVHTLREEGDEDGAFEMLETELKRSARNRDAVSTYWQMALDRGVPEQARPFLVQLVDEELRRGADKVAVGVWRTLMQHTPEAPLDAARLVALAPTIGRVEGRDSIRLALGQALDAGNKGLTAQLAAKISRMAAELDPELAAAAARRALDSFDLEPAEQEELQMLAQALRPNEEKKKRSKALPASVIYEETDRSAFGEISDLSELESRFPEGRVTEADRFTANARGLRFEVPGEEPVAVAFGRVRAVSIAGVKGMGEKPVILLDILLDGHGCELPLSVMRLRCDRFDPRSIVPKAAKPLDALRAIVKGLAKQSALQRLPQGLGEDLSGLRVFDSIEAYDTEVMVPAGAKLG